jgi:hypothetical protein
LPGELLLEEALGGAAGGEGDGDRSPHQAPHEEEASGGGHGAEQGPAALGEGEEAARGSGLGEGLHQEFFVACGVDGRGTVGSLERLDQGAVRVRGTQFEGASQGFCGQALLGAGGRVQVIRRPLGAIRGS